MKRFAAFLLCITLLLSACTPAHKASGQRKTADVLHAYGTDILTAEGTPVSLRAADVTLTAESEDAQALLLAAFAADGNAVRLRFDGSLLADDAALTEQAAAYLTDVLERCEQTNKYLLFGLYGFTREYALWDADGEEAARVAAAYADAASYCGASNFFGGYEIGSSGYPADEGKKTALSFYEAYLQTVADAIRKVDKRHMLILRRMPKTLYSSDEYEGFPVIRDRNFMVAAEIEELDFYLRAAPGVTLPQFTYPNEYLLRIRGAGLTDEIQGESLSTGIISDQDVTSDVFYVDPEKGKTYAEIGMNVLPSDATAGGELRVMALTLYRCDKDGNSEQAVYRLENTKNVPFYYLTAEGERADGSFYEDGSAYLESINTQTYFFVKNLAVPLESGGYYKLTVRAKQRGMRSGYLCTPCIYARPYESAIAFDGEGLTALVKEKFSYAEKIGVPILFTGIRPDAPERREGFSDDLEAAIRSISQSYSE